MPDENSTCAPAPVSEGTVSRRAVLAGAGALASVAALGIDAFPARAAVASPAPAHPAGTTLERTLLRGPRTAAGGYCAIVAGPGEPYLVRTDLGIAAQTGRAARRRAVVAFAQLTDTHIIDAQSPARVEFLDRYSPEVDQAFDFSAAYRPQEMLTIHVLEAMVQRLVALGVGPATGRPLGFVVSTGDNTDNTQRNEFTWMMKVLDGQPVRPDSGDMSKWEGVHDQDATTYDTQYWHPDGTPTTLPTAQDDEARSLYGFPLVRGLLDAARRPFAPVGLGVPWLSTFGNHDGLVQGNAPQPETFAQIATGPLKVVGLTGVLSPADASRALSGQDPAALAALFAGPARVVTADPERATITRTESVALQAGHGYGEGGVPAGVAYWSRPLGGLLPGTLISLDTVNPNGLSDGSIDTAQLAWLEALLVAGSRSYLSTTGDLVTNAAGSDRLFVVVSHHSIASMTNGQQGLADQGRRVLGPEVRDLLLRFPNVVLWVNGHTHRNEVTPHKRTGGSGFWEINTASHVDWPQQARVVEIADNQDGTLSIFGTVVDHAAAESYGRRTDSALHLASLSRELAANDWQERVAPVDGLDHRRGRLEDRNVELLVRAPAWVRPATRRPSGGTSGGATLPTTGAPESLAALGLLAAVGGAVALRRRQPIDG
jgi:metallophosphoesterase (TIGR03767 family)